MVGNLGRKARLRRRQSLLSPMYSLGRSRGGSALGRSHTMLRKAPKRSGAPVARVSSGPTGMYTEHIAWARTPTSPAKEGLRPDLSTVQILAHADYHQP